MSTTPPADPPPDARPSRAAPRAAARWPRRPLPGRRLAFLAIFLHPASPRLDGDPLLRLLLRRTRQPSQMALSWLYASYIVGVHYVGKIVFGLPVEPFLRVFFVFLALGIIGVSATLDHLTGELGRFVQRGWLHELLLTRLTGRDLGGALGAAAVGIACLPFATMAMVGPFAVEERPYGSVAGSPTVSQLVRDGLLLALHLGTTILVAVNVWWWRVVAGGGGLRAAHRTAVAALFVVLGGGWSVGFVVAFLVLLVVERWFQPDDVAVEAVRWVPLAAAPILWFVAGVFARRAEKAWSATALAERLGGGA